MAPGEILTDAPLLDDQAWIAQVRQGDENASRALFQRLYPTVIKSVRSHLPRRSSEGDLAQAAFLKIFKHLDQFSGRVPLEHWVSRITINTCLTELRRECGRPELRMSDLTEGEETVLQQALSSSEESLAERPVEAQELVRKLLSMLRPDERLVITLLHIEERSTKQIAELTGWSVSRVKVKAFRARVKMRRIWAQLLDARADGDEPKTASPLSRLSSFAEALELSAMCRTGQPIAGN